MIARHRLSQSVASVVWGISVLIATENRGQEVRDTSYIAPDGSRVLWHLGVGLQPGRTNRRAGNIKNRILSFLPVRMLSFQVVAAPPGFARAKLLPDIVTVIELEELGPSSVRVTESMVGYKPGEGYDTLYRLFEAGNAWSLKKLYRRFIEGPIEWQKTLRRTRQ